MAQVPAESLRQLEPLLDPSSTAAETLNQLMVDAEDDYNKRVAHLRYMPTCGKEIFTRYVFPVPRVDRKQPPAGLQPHTPTNSSPVPDTPLQTLHISFAPLDSEIENHVLSKINCNLPADSPTMKDYHRRYIASYEPIMKSPPDDICAMAMSLLGYPINCLLADPAMFKSGCTEDIVPRWYRPGQASHWLCPACDNDVRAVMEWKRETFISTGDMTTLWAAAARRTFSVALESNTGAITGPAALSPNCRKVIFQLWAQAHLYQCRWMLLFNTKSMLVWYLAGEAGYGCLMSSSAMTVWRHRMLPSPRSYLESHLPTCRCQRVPMK